MDTQTLRPMSKNKVEPFAPDRSFVDFFFESTELMKAADSEPFQPQ